MSALEGLLRVEGCVNAAVNDPGAAFARHAADLISAQCIASVYADPGDIAPVQGGGVDWLQRFVDQDGLPAFRCSASKLPPFFQSANVMAAILRANVRRAISGFIPLASKLV